MNNLQGVMDHLHKWSKKTIGNVSKQIDKKKKQLDQILKRDDSNSKKRANILCREIDELLEKEELRWRQRSRVNWLQAGDRNTRYFHRKATWRAKKNKITELVNNKGVVTQDDKEMNTIATEFFMELYKADNTVQPDLGHQTPPELRKFFELGSMPDGVNDTAIVLIPKIKNPTNLKDYRPISLCNVVYKVMVKCLVNRLRPLLKSIIAETQSAFVPERMITDNAIIAFECFHAIHNGNKSSGSFCAYKLDLTKAYDRVDWKFLEEALRTMGFAEQWIKWIMTCVKTVRFSVKFNGKLLEKIYPSRGLRQGDPLSPYLFLLVGESLSALINRNINHNLLQELKISRNCPGISHLMFADDSLLFFRANTDQASRIKEILSQYEKGTGQLLSSDKCSIMFGQHVPDSDMQSVAYILEVNKMTMEDKYLGLPIPEGSMKQGKLISSKDKLRKKCSDWNEKYMSGAAKEALIKSVAQSISNYAMTVFKFPMGLCDDMSQIIREFWWGDEVNKRKVHWLSWDKITKSKNMGGMGFKDLRMFNQALLARQAWRLIQFPESLCARLLKAKYYPSGQLIDTAFSKSVSPCWQGISYGLELLKKAQNASHTSDVKGKKVMNCHSMDSLKAKEIPKPWNAPNLGWHKLNIDAGFIDDLNMGSWGAILRDHNGIVAASAWGTLPHCPNVATAEGLAILKGAKAIVNHATTQVIIESDNAAIVQEINRATISRSQLCFLATDIKEVLSLIPGYVVNKINRTGNTAAHCLANYALRMRNEGVLLNVVPPCVEDLINLDCNRCCNSATCV
ncbi:hypothetical protein QYE76_062572 [Lolium multiflorum]|uniref:Reverse transcriptase domain-containing protein n=1 Tax=Lolium multiflorum TaxID=4521 RepID=A0AAD8S3F0_LOLMU|nr:hypothetical protein QYE76_062572 [Lolium multiflorum]